MSAENAEMWERFLAHAERAFAKPTFDAEERVVKIEVAASLRTALAAATDGGEWIPLVKQAIREGLAANITTRAHRHWFKAWATTDPDSLRSALAAFAERSADAQERLRSFASMAAEAESKHSLGGPPGTVLALGSLFNLAVETESLPLVRAWHFGTLEELLGFGSKAGAADPETYPRHVDFAGEADQRLRASGIAVRDMIDVQSLIFIGALENRLWSGDRLYPVGVPPPSAPSRSPRGAPASHLAVCAIYRNEAAYLREWIEFHRLVGVERFFLYDNRSTDQHREQLAPYVNEGIVTVHEWDATPPNQRDTYEHCLAAHRDDARWIAFIDIDEFLFSPAGMPVPELLGEFEPWPGVGVNWACFGTSGHRTKPSGPVIESYTMRVDAPANRFIKSIVDPMRVERCITAHHFAYDSLLAVDENHYPIHGAQTKSVSFSRLRINHYVTKSEAEARMKLGRGTGWEHSQRWRSSKLEEAFPQERDEAIVAYVPQLRRALAETAARTSKNE